MSYDLLCNSIQCLHNTIYDLTAMPLPNINDPCIERLYPLSLMAQAFLPLSYL